MFLAVLIILILFFILFAMPLGIYACWVSNTKEHNYHTKLDKDTIKKLYQVAPKRWKIKSGYGESENYIVYKTDDYKEIYVYTSFSDALWLLYNWKIYNHQEYKKDRQQIKDDSMQLILKQNKKDSDNLKGRRNSND